MSISSPKEYVILLHDLARSPNSMNKMARALEAAGMQLGTTKQSVPNSLGAVDFDLGIIAGTRNIRRTTWNDAIASK